MTKNEWLQICRLNMEWYFVHELGLSKEYSDEHMPSDKIFDNGMIEFFQENFKPEIDEMKLDDIAREYCNELVFDNETDFLRFKNTFKAGYRKALEK